MTDCCALTLIKKRNSWKGPVPTIFWQLCRRSAAPSSPESRAKMDREYFLVSSIFFYLFSLRGSFFCFEYIFGVLLSVSLLLFYICRYLSELLLQKGYEVHGVVRCCSTSNTERLNSVSDSVSSSLSSLIYIVSSFRLIKNTH